MNTEKDEVIIEIKDRTDCKIIEISTDSGDQLFRITATTKGIDIVGIFDFGDMVIRPKTSNSVSVLFKEDTRI